VLTGRSADFGARRAGDRATIVTLGHLDGGILAKVTDHGATLVELHVPDRNGRRGDVVLGYGSVAGYEADTNPYVGATVGRVANRIAHASFELAGRRYRLARNEPPHHLHGGARRSFDKVRWSVAERSDEAVTLRHVSPDGDEGYPGRVDVSATYRVAGDTLTIDYRAVTDAPTPLDLTNHSYLNLHGAGAGSVLEHHLQVDADRCLVVDDELLPTGATTEVANTALDLRTPARLGVAVAALADGPTEGLDHHYVLRDATGGLRPVARLLDPVSGRHLELATDQPGLQVYTAGHLAAPVAGKNGHRYARHAAVCLEASHHPDALHHPAFPSIVLAPGETYRHTTSYRFSTAASSA
jgi:aldose 1-epimerase